MSPFRRKREAPEAEEPATTTTETEEPDPAAWALPADAGAVTTDAGTAATDAAAVEEAEPEVAAPVDPSPAPETAAAAAWTPPPAVNEIAEQRPEVLVAAAFAGAFVFARILKRITD